MILLDENSLAVRCNPHRPNLAGKRNQLARVRAILLGNKPVRSAICPCSVCSLSELGKNDAAIREDICIFRLKIAEPARLSSRKRNQP
jgi:hypothetical protein